MTFHKIDMQAWERKKRYEHYAEAVPCTYSMTVALDVTKLLCGVREKELPFFPVVLYGLAREVNRHAEFRMAQDEMGNVGYYSHCDPCYTVFHKETESFTEVWTAYDASPAVFLARYREDMARYRNAPELSKPPAGKNLFNVSCIPWSSFTGFNLNLQNGYDYFLPIFTIGKYFSDGGKMRLPLAVQVHHAVCDGYHLSRFINGLQTWMEAFPQELEQEIEQQPGKPPR